MLIVLRATYLHCDPGIPRGLPLATILSSEQVLSVLKQTQGKNNDG